jgi:putative transposase
MIDRTHALPVSQQARLVGIATSSVHYRAQSVSEADQLLMRRIDQLHMKFPFAGARMPGATAASRRTRDWPQARAHTDEAHRYRRAVLQAEHEPTQCTTQDLAVLLRGMTINRANQVLSVSGRLL